MNPEDLRDRQFFGVRLDVLKEVAEKLAVNQELKSILGEPVLEKINVLSTPGDITLSTNPDIDLDDDAALRVTHVFEDTMAAVVQSKTPG